MQPFFKNDGKLIWYIISYHNVIANWPIQESLVLICYEMDNQQTCFGGNNNRKRCWKVENLEKLAVENRKSKWHPKKWTAAMEKHLFFSEKKLKWTELMSWVACYVLLMLWKSPGEIFHSEFGRVRNCPVFKHIQISLGDMGIPPISCEKKLEHDDTPWFGVVLCSNTPLPSGYFT